MAHNVDGFRLPMRAASAIAQYVPVAAVGDQFNRAGSALSETIIRAGSFNEFPLGFTTATGASPGQDISVQVTGVVKGIAGGSLGAGALLAVGSTNGILIPRSPSGGPASANLLRVEWVVGYALKNAAAGDLFPVVIKPDQIT